MLKLLENAKIRAFDEGKEEGYYEGYEEGRSLASEDKQNDGVFEILRREDEEKA
jgi:flagellar biosynthesis/type III secretory pathway protein FliH